MEKRNLFIPCHFYYYWKALFKSATFFPSFDQLYSDSGCKLKAQETWTKKKEDGNDVTGLSETSKGERERERERETRIKNEQLEPVKRQEAVLMVAVSITGYRESRGPVATVFLLELRVELQS